MKPIYLELHHKDTRKSISAHIKQFNSQLEQEWLKDQGAFKEKYCSMFFNQEELEYWEMNPEHFKVRHKKKYEASYKRASYKSCMVKYQTATVVFKALDAFATSLFRNKNAGIVEPEFRTSNGFLAQKLNISKVTVWRHIKRATYCGIFDYSGYEWHGSNSSYEIEFNPKLLIACHNDEYTKTILQQYQLSVNNLEIPVEKRVEILAERPRFTDAKNGCMISTCNHIVTCNKLQEQNINMEEAVFVNNLAPLSLCDVNKNEEPKNSTEFLSDSEKFTSHCSKKLQEQGSINGKEKNTLHPLPSNSCGSNKQEQVPRGRDREKEPQNVDYDLLNFNIETALRLTLSVLYRNRFVSEHDIEVAKKHLAIYFNPEHKTRKMYELANDLQLSIYEAYKTIQRKGYTPAPLWRYFDPRLSGGFYQTLKHVETVVKPYMEKQADFAKSISEVMKLYKIHMKNPNDFESYRKATQYLGKKKNKVYLEFFNQAVVSGENITNSAIRNYINQNNNQA